MNQTRSQHQSWINCPSNDSSQRIPGSFIKPVEEVVVSILYHVMGCSVIKPRGIDIKIGQQNTNKDTNFITHQGSNSWIILSNRITAKSLEQNPATQARNKTQTRSRYCLPIFSAVQYCLCRWRADRGDPLAMFSFHFETEGGDMTTADKFCNRINE